jgi:hypothetical protein
MVAETMLVCWSVAVMYVPFLFYVTRNKGV